MTKSPVRETLTPLFTMKKITALIVEDEQDSRETLQNYLGKYCKEVNVVAECPNIQIAQKAIQIHQPDLVFLDIEMPYGNAFDLLEQLKEIDFEIIFITAFDAERPRQQAYDAGAIRFLRKPLDSERLIEAIQSALGEV